MPRAERTRSKMPHAGIVRALWLSFEPDAPPPTCEREGRRDEDGGCGGAQEKQGQGTDGPPCGLSHLGHIRPHSFFAQSHATVASALLSSTNEKPRSRSHPMMIFFA